MPGKNPATYSTDNNLDYYIRKRHAERTLKGEFIRVTDVKKEILSYCGIANITLQKLINKENQASLPVALKIAEYFGEPLEKLFFLKKE